MRSDTILTELEACKVLRQRIRAEALVYQYADKLAVSAHFGIPFELCDVPFKSWMALRRLWLADR